MLVYFIAPSDGHVYRRNLTGDGEQRVYELHSTDENDRLFVRPQAADTNRWDLMARLAAALLVWKREDVMRALLYHRPISFNASFHEAVAGADRIVVRRGGFDCCRAVGNDEILVTVSGIQEVHQVMARFEFEPEWVTNAWEFGGCWCSGYPGMDWYRGGTRVALTSVQYGKSVQWQGFPTARILGVKVGYGDAPLTSASRAWLNQWLADHGAAETPLDQERNKAVGESLEAPDAPPVDVETP